MAQTPLQLSSKLTPLFSYLKKQQENRKFRQTLELAATLILISFFLLFAIRPTALTISALVGEIKSKQLLTRDMKSKINQVIAAQDIFSQVQERYSIIESCLPSLPRFSQATSQLDGILTKNQFETNQFNFSLTKDSYFTTSISTASSFISSLTLLSDLLNNRRLLGLPSLNFSVDKSTAANRQITFSFPINVYYWPEIKK